MKRVSLLLALMVLLGCGIASAQRAVKVVGRQAPASEQRVALVIGNSAYTRISSLRNPVNDARDMAAALRASGFRVRLLLDATRLQMGEAIGDFEDALRKGGVGLFFFAGHGVQVGGVNYLIPIGANIRRESQVQYESISANRVLSTMEAAGNRLNMVFLDACRNNPYKGSRFRSLSRGLAAVRNAPKGSLISYATGAGDVAEDGTGRNGTYTKNLLRHLRTPGLELTQLMKRVRAGVQRDTGNRQTPYELSSLTGDFYFSRAGVSASVPVTANVPKRPGGPRFSLGDLNRAAQSEQASRRAWGAKLKEMKDANGKVVAYERQNISPSLKITAWQRLLAAFAENNPYTNEDDGLRRNARARIGHWQGVHRRLADTGESKQTIISKRNSHNRKKIPPARRSMKKAGIYENPKTPENYYHNARVFELTGDYGNARRAYLKYFRFKEQKLDPHIRFQKFLKIQEGRAGALEIYRDIFETKKDWISKFSMVMLESNMIKRKRLIEFSKGNKNFAPLYYELSRLYSYSVLGHQSNRDKLKEKQHLKKFFLLVKNGNYYRYFIDKGLADKYKKEADKRYAVLKKISTDFLRNPIRLRKLILFYNSTIMFQFIHMGDIGLEYKFRTKGTKYKSTGFITSIRHPITGGLMPDMKIQGKIADFYEKKYIEVIYIDVNKNKNGPFRFKINMKDDIINKSYEDIVGRKKFPLLTEKNPIVSLTFKSDFKSGWAYRTISFNRIAKYKCGLKKLVYSINNDKLDKNLPLGDCDNSDPIRTKKELDRLIIKYKYKSYPNPEVNPLSYIAFKMYFYKGTKTGYFGHETEIFRVNGVSKRIKSAPVMKKSLVTRKNRGQERSSRRSAIQRRRFGGLPTFQGKIWVQWYSEGLRDYQIAMQNGRDQNQLKSAIQKFNNSIKLNPKNLGPYIYRGLSYGGLGKSENCKRDLLKATKFGFPKKVFDTIIRNCARK